MTPDREYHARFAFDHAVDFTMRMLDHNEHRWQWCHYYAPRTAGERTPEIVNDLRLNATYIEGVLALPLKLVMHVIIPARLGKRFILGMDVSPGAKTYIEFHYGDPDAARTLRLMRIEIGALRFLDLPRIAEPPTGTLVAPLVEFPFPVLECLPCQRGRYRVPFMPEEHTPVRADGVPQWPTLDVPPSIRRREDP